MPIYDVKACVIPLKDSVIYVIACEFGVVSTAVSMKTGLAKIVCEIILGLFSVIESEH